MNEMVDHILGDGRNDLWLRVGGLISASEEHVTWRNQRLELGDSITVTIRETDIVDEPVKRKRNPK